MEIIIVVKEEQENGSWHLKRDVYNNCNDIYIYRGDFNFKSNGNNYFIPLKKVISIDFK